MEKNILRSSSNAPLLCLLVPFSVFLCVFNNIPFGSLGVRALFRVLNLMSLSGLLKKHHHHIACSLTLHRDGK